MAHHKRRKPKSARSGCLLCKPWKANGSKRRERMRHSDSKRLYSADRDVKIYLHKDYLSYEETEDAEIYW